mgnify:CR=1 FL=1
MIPTTVFREECICWSYLLDLFSNYHLLAKFWREMIWKGYLKCHWALLISTTLSLDLQQNWQAIVCCLCLRRTVASSMDVAMSRRKTSVAVIICSSLFTFHNDSIWLDDFLLLSITCTWYCRYWHHLEHIVLTEALKTILDRNMIRIQFCEINGNHLKHPFVSRAVIILDILRMRLHQ